MADLVVQDLDDLAKDLDYLIGEFEGALDLQDDDKGLWGQLNANLSMGDFAYNWRIHRDRMVTSMKKFSGKVKKVDEAWGKADQKLHDSFQET